MQQIAFHSFCFREIPFDSRKIANLTVLIRERNDIDIQPVFPPVFGVI